jgi:hypothetical protein
MYPLQGVTSVAKYRSKPNTLVATIVLGAFGALLFLGGIGDLLTGSGGFGLVFCLIGVGLWFLAVWCQMVKYRYLIVLTTAAREITAFESEDQALVRAIYDALNQAIVARG